MRITMKKIGMRLTAVTLSAVIAMSCTGCSAVTGVLDRFGIEIPGLTGNKTESAAAADTAALGATNTNTEQASAEEPAAEPISPEEERRRRKDIPTTPFCPTGIFSHKGARSGRCMNLSFIYLDSIFIFNFQLIS
jgi:hypothetical protein